MINQNFCFVVTAASRPTKEFDSADKALDYFYSIDEELEPIMDFIALDEEINIIKW